MAAIVGCGTPDTSVGDACPAESDHLLALDQEIPAALRQVSDLGQPTAAAFPPWAPDELWVTRKLGELVSVTLDGSTSTVLLDISERVWTEIEAGLVGLAIAPDRLGPLPLLHR